MTISEVINRIDALKPNAYTIGEKIAWLSEIEGKIKKEIVDTHEGAGETEFNGYDDSTPLTTSLIAKAPYDDVYTHYICAQIDYTNGEFKKYENSMGMFNAAYSTFERAYNREHMPKGKHFKYF